MKIKECIRRNYINSLFLMLGIFFIGIIKGFEAGLFVFLLLLLLSTSIYTFLSFYNLLKKTKDNYTILKILLTIITSMAIYYKYGLYPLLKIFSLSLIIFLVVIFSLKYDKK